MAFRGGGGWSPSDGPYAQPYAHDAQPAPTGYGASEAAGTGMRPLSVSQAMQMAKSALERVTVTLVGEVSEVSDKPGYKACYFTVKDTGASMPCLMWKNRYNASGVVLQVGMKVQLTGRFSLYARKGRMNFDVFRLELAGRGRLYAQIKAVEDRLRREGLMAPERKRPIPRFPRAVGVVTSPRGAAVHDVLRTLRRRFPLARVLFAGVPVEGAQAPANITAALQKVAEAGPDVILLVRGGGSFEDLMPFNDEGLARAVAACPVPIITGIGHEPDNSIADEVADMRQSTPTGAAEAAVPNVADLMQDLDDDLQGMTSAVRSAVSAGSDALDRVLARPLFRDPRALFSADEQALVLARQALGRDFPRRLAITSDAVRGKGVRLAAALPGSVQKARAAMDQDGVRMAAAMRRSLDANAARTASTANALRLQGKPIVERPEQQLAMRTSRLDDLSPLHVVARGYAMARDGKRRVVHSVSQVSKGDRLDVQVSDGVIGCTVDGVESVELKGVDV